MDSRSQPPTQSQKPPSSGPRGPMYGPPDQGNLACSLRFLKNNFLGFSQDAPWRPTEGLAGLLRSLRSSQTLHIPLINKIKNEIKSMVVIYGMHCNDGGFWSLPRTLRLSARTLACKAASAPKKGYEKSANHDHPFELNRKQPGDTRQDKPPTNPSCHQKY